METGRHEGRPIYGPRPSERQMASRAKGEGFQTKDLFPVLLDHDRYLVEAWARFSPYKYNTLVAWDAGMQPVYKEEDGILTYRLRRDGKVVSTGRTEPISKVVLV